MQQTSTFTIPRDRSLVKYVFLFSCGELLDKRIFDAIGIASSDDSSVIAGSTQRLKNPHLKQTRRWQSLLLQGIIKWPVSNKRQSDDTSACCAERRSLHGAGLPAANSTQLNAGLSLFRVLNDLSPIPTRSATKWYLTSWYIQRI